MAKKEKTRPFTMIDNEFIWLKKAQLSDRAFRVMVYIWSLPDWWELSPAGMAVKMDRCRDTMSQAFKELREAGLIEMKRLSSGKTIYTVKSVAPSGKAGCGNIAPSGKTTSGKTTSGNSVTIKDYTVLKTKLNEIEKVNQKESEENVLPFDLTAESPKQEPAPLDGFDDFYDTYGRKKGRVKAQKAWITTTESRPPLPELLSIVSAQRKAEGWDIDNGFQPYPATWLNGKLWENEIEGGSTPDYEICDVCQSAIIGGQCINSECLTRNEEVSNHG